MSYFNKILGGNIPSSIAESMGINIKNYNFQQNFSYYQISEGKGDIPMSNDINDILKSQYGSYINKSLELNRDKVLEGVKKIISNSLEIALENNLSELIKLEKKSDSNQSNLIISTFTKNFSEQFLIKIKELNLSYDLFKLHIKLVHLSGLSGLPKKTIEEMSKQLALELELPTSFKTDTFIDVKQTFIEILKPSAIKKCGTDFNCLFDKVFIDNFSLVILGIWETILDNIMESVKYDKLISLYTFGVSFSDSLYFYKNTKPKVIENLLNVGNSTKLSDSTKVKDLKTIENKIDQSKVMKGMTALLSSAITNAVNKNSADLLRSIAASNKISVGSATGSSFTFTKIKQTTTIQQETNANFVQQVTTKVINDIGAKLKENINMSSKQATSDVKKIITDEKLSTSMGGIIDSVTKLAGKGLDALGKVLEISCGNSVNQSTSKDISQELRDMFNLNQSFKYEKNDDVKSSLQNILSTENLAKCAADTKAENIIDLNKINTTGPIVIGELEQNNVVKDVMNCAFNQTVVNDITNKILNDYDKMITQLIENVNNKLDDQNKTLVQGDIYAAGVAGSAILQSAGEAAKDLGQGVGVAGKGVGEGAGAAAKGIGEGMSTAMSGLMMPLLIGGVILVILIIGYVIFKSMNKNNNDNDE
jgi:hypothetical protein